MINVTKRFIPRPRHGKVSFIGHCEELNRITVEEFRNIVRDLDCKVIMFETKMIRRFTILHFIQLMHNYLTYTVVTILLK